MKILGEYLEQFKKTLTNQLDKMLSFPIEDTPESSLREAITEVTSFGKFAFNEVCPYCQQKNGFIIDTFEHGSRAWEYTFHCNRCGTIGVVNTTGFKLQKGRKEEEEEPSK